MKKIILLVFILFIPLIIINNFCEREKNYPNLTKDEKWEYVKERIIPNGQSKLYNFSGPILYEIYNATSKDSAAIKILANELEKVLPNKKIGYFKNYTGFPLGNPYVKNINDNKEINGYSFERLKKHAIRLFFDKKKETIKINDSVFQTKEISFKHFSHVDYGDFSGLLYPEFKISIGDRENIEERKKYLTPFFVRTIACSGFFYLGERKIIDLKKSILNDKKIVSIDYEFSEQDKFLLQKLYDSNLKKQLKKYIYKTYPLNYAGNYFSKANMKIMAIWVCLVFGIVLIVLGFSVLYNKTYRYNYFNYLIPLVVLSMGILSVGVVYSYFSFSGKLFREWNSYFGVNLIFLGFSLLWALLLMLFDKYFVKNSMNFTTQFILKISFTLLVFILPMALIHFSNKSRSFISFNPFIFLSFIVTLGRGILLYFNHFSQNLIKQKDVELSNLKVAKAEAEVNLLQSQINPHFLYNSLNSIASLAHKDASKTEEMALSLSDLFKYTINRKGKKESTVRDEVDMVKNYLEVEQIRFGDRLHFQINIDEKLNDVKIPMFLIQPLIENAVKHGISKIETNGVIQLKIETNNTNLKIKVIDNGPEFPDGMVSGHGLQTVYELLKLSYGNKAIVNIKNKPEKAIIITINNIA